MKEPINDNAFQAIRGVSNSVFRKDLFGGYGVSQWVFRNSFFGC